MTDGNEDIDRNGMIDADETDPNDGGDDLPMVDTDGDGLSDASRPRSAPTRTTRTATTTA
ncbi:hypothetical protein BE20_04965 [Sorangium cellulosum]|nr:hypothetical protein BE20_04965 [Sorangium cellulosum]